MMPFKTLSLIVCLLWTVSGAATNYYFSVSAGDDNRSFSEAQNPETPWKSIEKLNEIFNRIEAGDSILFKRGETFHGGIVISRGGTEDFPIVIGAYGQGGNPKISGFVSVTNWHDVGNGVYESDPLSTGSSVNMVTINEINYAKGRYPNTDQPDKGYLIFEEQSGTSITDNEFEATHDWTGGQIVLRTTPWTIERREITGISGTKISYNSGTVYGPKPGYGYFIQDHIKTLDRYGEWYYDPSSRKLSVFFGDNPPDEFTSIRVAAVDVLIAPRASHIVVENMTLEGANEHGIFYEGSGMDNLQVYNSEIRYSGIDAVYLVGWSNFVIEDCHILNSNNCGLRLLGQDPYSVVRNNVIRNTGLQPGMGGDGDGHYVALFTATRGLVAEYNRIINSGYIGIRFAEEDILVKNNYINNFCLTMDDGGGIYTYDSRSSNGLDRRIIGNIVVNGPGAPEGTPSIKGAAEGIYLDDESTGIEVSGNTVANVANKGIFVHNSRKLMIRGNTVFNNGAQFSTVNDSHGEAITELSVSDNIFFAREISQWAAYLKSQSKDFKAIGKFDNNYYVRPLDDSLTINLEYQTPEGGRVNQPYTLSDWQEQYDFDGNSKKSPIKVEPYLIDDESDENQVSNGTFDNNIVGTWCWSSVTDCLTSWKSDSEVGSGTLQVAGEGPSYLGMNCGSMEANAYYILRFSAAASAESNIEIFLQQSNWPWERMSVPQAVKIGTSRQEYELMFTVPVGEELASLQFGFDDQGHTYWLDNIEFKKVDARMTDPATFIRFEYNAGKESKTVQLLENYIDVRGKTYSGEVQIRPFESLILIRKGKVDDEPGPDTDNEPGPEPDAEPANEPKGEPEENPEDDPDEWHGEAAGSTPDQEPDSSPDPEEPQRGQSIPIQMGNPVGKPVGKDRPHGNFPSIGNIDLSVEPLPDWKLYPNPLRPGNSQINLEFYTSQTEAVLTIINQHGQVLKTRRMETYSGTNYLDWEIGDLPAGSYYIINVNEPAPSRKAYPFVVIR